MGMYVEWNISITAPEDMDYEVFRNVLDSFAETHEYLGEFYHEGLFDRYRSGGRDGVTIGGESTSLNAYANVERECVSFLKELPGSEIEVYSKGEEDEADKKTVYKDGEIINFETIVTYKESGHRKIEEDGGPDGDDCEYCDACYDTCNTCKGADDAV